MFPYFPSFFYFPYFSYFSYLPQLPYFPLFTICSSFPIVLITLRLAALRWVNEFILMGETRLVQFHPNVLSSVMYCISDEEPDINLAAKIANQGAKVFFLVFLYFFLYFFLFFSCFFLLLCLFSIFCDTHFFPDIFKHTLFDLNLR